MLKFNFAKLMSAIVCAYILVASIYPVENSVANIGFLLSLATLWANPPGTEDQQNRRY
jgi:hypothetical protein